jgi:biotin synthase-related radical SAM superfamily protein
MHRSLLEDFTVQKENREYFQISMAKGREVEYSKKNFIRVEWPTVVFDEIVERAEEVSCDKLFGDNFPTDIKSYPFKPEKGDLERIRKQLFDCEMTTNYPDIINPKVFRYQ